jgi:hypothetical protein
MKKNQIKQAKKSTFMLIILTMIGITFQTSCKKVLEKKEQTAIVSNTKKKRSTTTETTVNPYSVINIKKALLALNRTEELERDRIYFYYKFNPQKISGEQLSKLEADSTSQILDYPFADGRMYNEANTNFTSTAFEKLKDGNLYIMYKSTSSINSIFENNNNIDAEKLNEIYLPRNDDEDLQLQALITSGYSNEPDLPSLKIKLPCLFKQPCGKVTYLDQETGTNKPVPRIKVWALVFGVPVTTHTNDNGNYWIPWYFSVGTFIGTHAENSRVLIKPLNTTGTWVGSALSLVTNFIQGSVYTAGWYKSCDMKNDINIHFGNHSQERYWAQLLDAVKHHYDYTSIDNIHHAPTVMTLYAQWESNQGPNAQYNASTPMLGHIQTNPVALFTNMSSLLFNTNLSVTVPNLYQLMNCLLPDMTIKVCSDINYYNDFFNPAINHYSEELMQTAFHELGHASFFHQVGQAFWVAVIGRTVWWNGYGNENSGNYWGLVQVNEAWAEFIGKEHHRRFHPNGQSLVELATNSFPNWENYPLAQEGTPWVFDTWINTGIFYDVLDNNTNEPFDNLGGFTIQNMFNCFGPNTNGFCDWRTKFIQNNPSVNLNTLNTLMTIQNEWSGICSDGWINPLNQ